MVACCGLVLLGLVLLGLVLLVVAYRGLVILGLVDLSVQRLLMLLHQCNARCRHISQWTGGHVVTVANWAKHSLRPVLDVAMSTDR